MGVELAGHGSGWPHTSPSSTAHVCTSGPGPHCTCTSPGSVSEIASSTNTESHRKQWGSSWGLGEDSMGSGQVPNTTTGALQMSPTSGAPESLHWNESSSPCHQGCLPAPYGCVWAGSCPPNPPSPAVSNGRWGDPGPSIVPAHSRCLREVSVNTSLLPLDPTGGNGVGRDQQSSVLSQTPSPASLTAQISCYDWNVTSGDVSPQPCK